jgi:hypothetical protein
MYYTYFFFLLRTTIYYTDFFFPAQEIQFTTQIFFGSQLTLPAPLLPCAAALAAVVKLASKDS